MASSPPTIPNQPSPQSLVCAGNLTTLTESSLKMAPPSEPASRRISTLNPVLGLAVGSDTFLQKLQHQRTFEELPAMELHSGDELRDDDDFGQPIRIRNPEGLGMNVPNESTSFKDKETVLSEIGSTFSEIEVIDVGAQETIAMPLDKFLDKFFGLVPSTTPLNCLSLEVTNTKMGARVQSPRFVRSLEWRKKLEEKSSSHADVRKYFILSMENSYTDFHVDLGGSSVWYHVVKGAKTFYFIAPTAKNLSLFERWQRLQNQREIFFGDMVDKCYKLELEQRETVIIPTGWIHGVLTTACSVVYGGNFLNSLNIPLQIKISELEERLQVAEKHRFPDFFRMHWDAAKNIIAEVEDFNTLSQRCPVSLLSGAQALLIALKKWIKRVSQNEEDSSEQKTVIRDLSRVIRLAQKNIPVTPCRESKRRVKKPVNTDFIDTSRVNFAKSEVSLKPDKTNAKGSSKAAVSATTLKHSSSPRRQEQCKLEEQPRLPALKLSKKTWLNPTPPSPPKKLKLLHPTPPPPTSSADLTNRDSVRLLLNTKKNTINLLNTELGDALAAFSRDEDADSPLVISEERPTTKKNKTNFEAKKERLLVEESGGEVYQDGGDYVYPSLEMSDDEEYGRSVTTAMTSSKGDTLWSPKVRVKKGGGTASGTAGSRPARENAKKKEVELSLKLASERLNMKKKQKKTKVNVTKQKTLGEVEDKSLPGTSSSSCTLVPKAFPLPKRLKKGEMTAKQRLGKKLGLKF